MFLAMLFFLPLFACLEFDDKIAFGQRERWL